MDDLVRARLADYNGLPGPFPAIVTGVNNYGTFVRTLDPHVDGKVVSGGKGLDVGDKVTVKLVSTDPQRGFIDFAV